MEDEFKYFCRKLDGFQENAFFEKLEINPIFSKAICSTIEKILGVDLERYHHSYRYLDIIFNATDDKSPFKIPDYPKHVRNVQSGDLKFKIGGDSDNVTYTLQITPDNYLELEYSNLTSMTKISMGNLKEKKKIEFLLNENARGVIFPAHLEFEQDKVLTAFQIYKPFFLRINKHPGFDLVKMEDRFKNVKN